MDGDPSRIRTCNPRSRNPLLAVRLIAHRCRPEGLRAPARGPACSSVGIPLTIISPIWSGRVALPGLNVFPQDASSVLNGTN
jgi:hypothetical protein